MDWIEKTATEIVGKQLSWHETVNLISKFYVESNVGCATIELEKLMSHISEKHFACLWCIDFEYILWAIIIDDPRCPKSFKQINDLYGEKLRDSSKKTDHWISWDLETGYKTPVSLGQWLEAFDKWDGDFPNMGTLQVQSLEYNEL